MIRTPLALFALALLIPGCPGPAPAPPDLRVRLATDSAFDGLRTPWQPTGASATRDERILRLIWTTTEGRTRRLTFTTPRQDLPTGAVVPIQGEGGATTVSYDEYIMGIPTTWSSTGGGTLTVLAHQGTVATVLLSQVPLTGTVLASGSAVLDYQGALEVGF